jgi:hypothetical protein
MGVSLPVVLATLPSSQTDAILATDSFNAYEDTLLATVLHEYGASIPQRYKTGSITLRTNSAAGILPLFEYQSRH